jgi:hypothetical protein
MDHSVARRASLERSTKLDAPPMGYWALGLYVDAAEASGAFRSATKRRGPGIDWATDPAETSADAARRARTHVRRYCAANRLNRLGTLTYRGEGCHDPAGLRGDVATFFRRLRSRIGEPLPYLWTPEWHKSVHGLHVHFAVGRYIRRGWIEAAWPHGFVHIKLLGGLPTGSAALQEARAAARYLAKYVGKDLGVHAAALHRYDVAQGFGPRRTDIDADTAREALALASRTMGRDPARIWHSSDVERWDHAPAVWASWD